MLRTIKDWFVAVWIAAKIARDGLYRHRQGYDAWPVCLWIPKEADEDLWNPENAHAFLKEMKMVDWPFDQPLFVAISGPGSEEWRNRHFCLECRKPMEKSNREKNIVN